MRDPVRPWKGDPRLRVLVLAGKQAYVDAGIEVHYEASVTGFDPKAHTVSVSDGPAVRYDQLVLATGFNYADPGVPGTDLTGLYYVKNIRAAWSGTRSSIQSSGRWSSRLHRSASRWSPHSLTAASTRT